MTEEQEQLLQAYRQIGPRLDEAAALEMGVLSEFTATLTRIKGKMLTLHQAEDIDSVMRVVAHVVDHYDRVFEARRKHRLALQFLADQFDHQTKELVDEI